MTNTLKCMGQINKKIECLNDLCYIFIRIERRKKDEGNESNNLFKYNVFIYHDSKCTGTNMFM